MQETPPRRRTAMRWRVTIEGMDEFGGRDTAEMVIEKEFSRLAKGEIGLTLSDGKTIMAGLQQFVVKQQCEAYVLTSRYCTDCQTFRRIKDYGKRKIRTVYGRVEVSNPRGPVAIYVGIDWRVFGRHEAIRSCGEVNDLIVWFLGEGLPSVDLAHGDLS